MPLGIAVARPVGIFAIWPGRIVVDVIEVTSYPIESVVALDGMVAVATSRLILTVSDILSCAVLDGIRCWIDVGKTCSDLNCGVTAERLVTNDVGCWCVVVGGQVVESKSNGV